MTVVHVRCRLCDQVIGLHELAEHFRDEHDLNFNVEFWPDGEPVVIDRSLEPADFEAKP